MSLSLDGRQVVCDGENCRASAFLPVGLRTLMPSSLIESDNIAGWLFVTQHDRAESSKQGEERHYCPCCAPHYLPALSGRRLPRRVLRVSSSELEVQVAP